MKSFKITIEYLPVVFLFLLTGTTNSFSFDISKYSHQASTTVVAKITYDPKAQTLNQNFKGMAFLTEKELSVDNISTATVQGILTGRLPMGKNNVDCLVEAFLSSGTLSTHITSTDISALITKWNLIYSSPSCLKKYQAKFEKLNFNNGTGFEYLVNIRSQFTYTIYVDIPISIEKLSVDDRTDDINKLVKFIRQLEGDDRTKTLLSNNKSNRPAFIRIANDGRLEAHHPFHNVIFDPRTKKWMIDYTDPIISVSELPEVKRLMKDKEVQEFVQSAGGNPQIKMHWESKKIFDATLIDIKSSKNISIKMIDGKPNLQK